MASHATNPFQVLGVDVDSDTEEIRVAYRNAARRHHPDRGGNAAEFGRITRSYRLLRDREHRARLRSQWAGSAATPGYAETAAQARVAEPDQAPTGRWAVMAAVTALVVFCLTATWSAAGPLVVGIILVVSGLIGCAAATAAHLVQLRRVSRRH